VLDRLALRIARRQGADQRLLEGRCAAGASQRVLHGVIGGAKRHELAGLVEKVPRQVVVWTRAIGHAPMGHGAARIMLQLLAEAFYALRVIVGVDPDQAAIEPELRLGRCRGDRPAELAEIVVAHVIPRSDQGMTIAHWLRLNRDNYCAVCFLSSATSFAVMREVCPPKRAVT